MGKELLAGGGQGFPPISGVVPVGVSQSRLFSSYVVTSNLAHLQMIFFCIFKFVFNWRIIALQCCVGFCHTAT